MFRQVVVVAAVLTLGLASHAEDKIHPIGFAPLKQILEVNVNGLIDENLSAIQSILTEMDPMDLPKLTYPVTPHIYLNLENGWMQNLSLMNRAGKCTLVYSQKVLTLNMNFGWQELVFDYRYHLKMLLPSRRGDLHGKLSDLKVNVVMEFDLGNSHVTLKKLDFANSGKIDISLEGHLTDALYNLVLKAVTTVAKDLILDTLEVKGIEMANVYIDAINRAIGKNHNRPLVFVNAVEPKHSKVRAYVN